MESVPEFVRAAREFCRLIESHRKFSSGRLLHRIEIPLARLYTAALQLPPVNSDEEIEDRMTQEEWSTLFLSLGRKLGPASIYWLVFDPTRKERPVAGSLADDFADIYRDIKPGLTAFSKGSAAKQEAAIWQWTFSLHSHWGRHACVALSVLRELRQKRRS